MTALLQSYAMLAWKFGVRTWMRGITLVSRTKNRQTKKLN